MRLLHRFLLCLVSEFKLFRSSLPIHLVALVQPSLMYGLMALILVTPTFDMTLQRTFSAQGQALVEAMEQTGSPVGDPYINPQLVDEFDHGASAQLIVVEPQSGVPTATQRFALVDSNQVKNYRNRLTAAALKLWNEKLGDHAVIIQEHPLLPRDVPYRVYFGMALLPLAAFLAASLIGAVLTAQDSEQGTVLEFRLSPAPLGLMVGCRIVRLVLTGLAAATVLVATMGIMTGYWPRHPLSATLILASIAAIGGSLGVSAALVLRRTLPAFVTALGSSLATWILGGAFGLPAGFSTLYAKISRLSPNTYAVELLFPNYYALRVTSPLRSAALLAFGAIGAVILTTILFRRLIVAHQD